MRRAPAGIETRTAGLLGAVGIVVLLSATCAFAGAGSRVVPVQGKVAGKGYAYYLQRLWQVTFATAPSHASACRTLTVAGKRVTLLVAVGATQPGQYKYTCREPAGQPLYVQQFSGECSTIKGDHNGFGTSGSQLQHCARALFKGAAAGASIDGKPLALKKLITSTSAYPIRLPKHNIAGTKARRGRSAARGYGLLLTGLSKGTHTIVGKGAVASAHFHVKYTYIINVG